MSDSVKGCICFVLMFPIKIYCIAPMMGFLVGTEWQDKNSWVSYIIGFGVACIIIIMFEGKGNKICAWCKSSKISFISGNKGKFYWKSKNKDGSRDKRVKDNYEIASYTSKYQCSECNAETKFNYYDNKDPNPKNKIISRILLKKGKKKRKGKNWNI